MHRGFEMNYGLMARDYDSMDDAISAVVAQGGKYIESERSSSGPLFYVYGSNALGRYKQALFQAHGRWHLGSVVQVNAVPTNAQSISTFMGKVRMARKDPRYQVGEDFPTLDAAVAHARTLPDGDKMVVYYKRGKFHLAAGPFRPIHPHAVGAMTENPIENYRRRRSGGSYYGRRHYFDDVFNALVFSHSFTQREANRALDIYRRDIHDYYNHTVPAAKTAGVIARYFPG